MKEIAKRMVVSGDLERDLIMQSLLKKQELVELEIAGTYHPGFVKKLEKDRILLALRSPLTRNIGGTVRVHFVFHNNHHYFDAVPLKKSDLHVQVTFPDIIFKNMLRRHERIGVQDKVFMRFKIMVQSEKKGFAISSIREERTLIQELNKPKPSIDKILNGIKHLVSDFAQNFQIRVFKPGETLSLDEEIVKGTKRIFLIYDSFEDSIDERRFYEEKVVTIADAYEYLVRRGELRMKAENRILDMLQQKRNGKIFSECLVPLMLEGETVGCIRLWNDMDYHRIIKPSFALRASWYAGILVEALVKYDYFSLESGDDFDIPVINVSAGGVLFKLERAELKRYLVLKTILQMAIQFPARQVEARGSIHRIDEEGAAYGVQLERINEVDARYIDDVVHGRISL